MRYLVAAVLAGVLLAPLPVEAAPNLAARAYKLAKRADAKATKALALPPTVLTGGAGERGNDGATGQQGAQGDRGPQGERGQRGVEGAPGPRGTEGAAGAKGNVGEQGPQGAAGEANLTARSTTNPDTVTVATDPAVVLTLPFTRDEPGDAFLSWDAQINNENTTADGVLCELRVDSATVSQRYATLPASVQQSLSGSALVSLLAGAHTAGVVCRKNSSLSLVQFPAERARLTVMAG